MIEEDNGAGRLHYVDTNLPNSPFAGKHYCNGGQSFFNGYDSQNPSYSFHPNQLGQQAYASIFKAAMS